MDAQKKEHIKTVIERFDASFYFYDLDLLKNHLGEMARALDPDIKLWYACKANPMSAILKVLRNLGFGIDVASSGELHQVLNAGIKGEHVIATGPGKSKSYLKHLLKNEVETIVLESYNQALWLNETAAKMNRKVNALIRVQLDWDSGKSVLGGDAVTPFGLGPKDWKKFDLSAFENINFKGFHIFQWGNILDPKKLEDIWDKSLQTIVELAKDLNIPLDIMDVGGGLGVPYKENEEAINFLDVHDILVKLKKKYDLKTIWMELGRF
ncbi:MAG: hypothetical protein WD025_05910, partial [Bacteriovoracaceae bacterium]